jgi:uncharacterized protein
MRTLYTGCELMKVPDNTAEVPTAPVLALAWPSRTQPIAPWWYTAILVAVIVAVSALSGAQSKAAGFGGSHLKRYAFTIAWECVLALFAWWGLRMRRTPLREILGTRRAGLKAWAHDFGIAMLFWSIAMIALGAIATLLRLLHLIAPQKAIIAIAPDGPAQLLVWIVLCVTAGIAEEFVFRGYLLQQFASLPLNRKTRGNVWIGVVVCSLLFGAAHGYEGVGGMIVIAAYGAMFCLLAMQRQSLRAGMIAHAWHDTITGIALAIAKHSHLV